MLQGSVGKSIRTRRVGRVEDAVKSSGRLEDKLQKRCEERTVDICGTSEYKNGGNIPQWTIGRQETSCHQNYSAVKYQPSISFLCHQNNSAAKSFCHRRHLVARPFRQQSLHQTKPLKIKRALPYRGTRTSVGHNRFYFGEGMPSVTQRS